MLDGGHIVISTFEGVRRRRLRVKTRNVLHIVGLLLVFATFALAITSDIFRLAGI